MKIVTTQQMRELDRHTIEDYGVPGETLMDRAGLGVAEVVDYLAKMWGYPDPPIILFAGRGNNGGDAFVAARYLKEHGYQVDLSLACEAGQVTGDALSHLSRARAAGISIRELPDKLDWDDIIASVGPPPGGIVIDGLLGTGIRGPARGPAAAAIQYVNLLSERCLVVSIDIPSGLNSDTGCAEGDAVKADLTLTMGLPKQGLTEPCALDYVGSVEVIDIGISGELVDPIEAERELITSEDLRGMFGRRPRTVHKGSFGHLLVIAGAAGYAGAAAMACRAALRSGVGLVTGLVPAGIAHTVAGRVPEAMVHSGPETGTGSLAADALNHWDVDIATFDAVLLGPGMTTHLHTRHLIEWMLDNISAPLILDADALNVMAGDTARLAKHAGPLVITPHPGEMARLLNMTTADVQADRFARALQVAGEAHATVVLKGAGTVVADPERRPAVNLTGNPGMAKGGMGDVLAGLMAGLAAQGMAPYDAARSAVYLHGRAADYSAWRTSQAGLIAGDVIEELANVFKEVSAR